MLILLDKYNYDSCIDTLKNKECWLYLSNDSIYNICGYLNSQENYGKFIKNLICMLLVVFSLLYNISFEKIYKFNLKYWFIAHISAFVFTLLNKIKILQFSFQTDGKYKLGTIIIIAIISLILFILILRQAFRQKGLRYGFLISIIMIYTFVYIMFKSVTSSIRFHLHHAIFAGFISICFTDFSSTINLYMHSIMMGIVIQGINFFTIQEIFLFNIKYIPSPTFTYMIYILSGYFIIWMILIFDISIFKRLNCKCCQKKQSEINPLENSLLLPFEEDNNSSIF